MTTYTIIWQHEGKYIWDRDDEEGYYSREELHIEYFANEAQALQRFADLHYSDDATETLELLIDGLDYADVDYDGIEAKLRPLIEVAGARDKEKKEAEKQRRAEAALAEARRIQEQQRRRDMAQLEELQRRLGIKS